MTRKTRKRTVTQSTVRATTTPPTTAMRRAIELCNSDVGHGRGLGGASLVANALILVN